MYNFHLSLAAQYCFVRRQKHFSVSSFLLGFTCNSCLFIPGVFFNFWSEVFTIINRKMQTFDLLIVKGDTLR